MFRFGILAAFALLIALPAAACSAVACIDHGVEMDRRFVIAIRHEGKPLQGVTVKVTGSDGMTRFSGATTSKGVVEIAGLLPGEYWLDASYLGFNAAYFCFHVAEHRSRRAKHRMQYEWGADAHVTNRIAGSVIDSQPGRGESLIWNITHRVNVPIVGAKLTLQHPVTRKSYEATSDQDGAFALDRIPAGVYALHIEGGRTGGSYEPSALLVRLDPKAHRGLLDLIRRESGGGSCGGPSLELLSSHSPLIP